MPQMVQIPKEEYQRMKATIETLQDKEVLEQFKESEKDVREEKVKSWKEVDKELEKL